MCRFGIADDCLFGFRNVHFCFADGLPDQAFIFALRQVLSPAAIIDYVIDGGLSTVNIAQRRLNKQQVARHFHQFKLFRLSLPLDDRVDTVCLPNQTGTKRALADHAKGVPQLAQGGLHLRQRTGLELLSAHEQIKDILDVGKFNVDSIPNRLGKFLIRSGQALPAQHQIRLAGQYLIQMIGLFDLQNTRTAGIGTGNIVEKIF